MVKLYQTRAALSSALNSASALPRLPSIHQQAKKATLWFEEENMLINDLRHGWLAKIDCCSVLPQSLGYFAGVSSSQPDAWRLTRRKSVLYTETRSPLPANGA
jgi:hypothetical protein